MKLESLNSEKFQVVPKSAMTQIVGGDLKYEYTKPLPPSPWDNDRQAYTGSGDTKEYVRSMEFKCQEELWPEREITGPFGRIR